MRVGLSVVFVNNSDWDRFLAREAGEVAKEWPEQPDARIWDEDVALGLQAEGLGFDSIWTIEHHFTPYALVPNPLQLLTFFAGATERINLGTMVVVLPWHHPLRVAEEATVLQNVLGPDRVLVLGLGRGAGRREFEAFGVSMDDSRGRFDEALDVIRLAVAEDRFSYDGTHYTVPETSMRPQARDHRLLENLYCAWGSPQTVPIAAAAGLKPLIIPQKAWADYTEEWDTFTTVRAEHGFEPAKPILAVWAYCAETEEEARAQGERYLAEYAETPLIHYELAGQHFATAKGYEHYAERIAEIAGVADLKAGLTQAWLDNSIYGTPQQCIDQIQQLHDDWNPEELIFVMRYGNMPFEDAQRSMRLFAEEVIPAVKALPDRPVTVAETA